MKAILAHPGPDFSVFDVFAGMEEGLKACGVDVHTYNLGDRLKFYQTACLPKEVDGEEKFVRAFSDDKVAATLASHGLLAHCYEFDPDVVIIVSGFFLSQGTLEIMRARGQKVVMLFTESPYEDDRQSMIAEHVDVAFVNDPTNLESLRRHNRHTYYMSHAYRPDVHRPGPAEDKLRSDFCIVGTGFPSRVQFLEQVGWDGIDACLAGYWPREYLSENSPIESFIDQNDNESIDNTDAVRLYWATKASANLYRKEAERPELSDGWAMGPREVELAATGTFFLREPRGEGDDVLSMLPTFKDPGDFGEQLRWWLANDERREVAAGKARAAVRDRTFEANARRLLSLI